MKYSALWKTRRKCQTPSKTQTDKRTNGQTDKVTKVQTPGIEFGAFYTLKM